MIEEVAIHNDQPMLRLLVLHHRQHVLGMGAYPHRHVRTTDTNHPFVHTTLPNRPHASFLIDRLRIGGVARDDVYVWGVLDGQNRMLLEAHQVAGQQQLRPLPDNINLVGVDLADVELGSGAYGLHTQAQIERFLTNAEDIHSSWCLGSAGRGRRGI